MGIVTGSVRGSFAMFCVLLAGCGMVDRMTGEADARQVRALGVAANAVVLAIRDTGITVNDDPVVDFDLEVRPEHDVAFPAQTRSRISRLDIPRIQPGAVLPVMFDPDDRQRVALAIYREEPAR